MARGFNYAPGASDEVAEARQPDVQRARLVVFAQSKNAVVRATIAGRDDCPLGLMVTLAHDGTPDVRAAVAGNPITHGTVMEFLATDRSVTVLLALVANPSLSSDLVSELALHKKADVRAAVERRLASGMRALGDGAREDSHNPELAEHVAPLPLAVPGTARRSTTQLFSRVSL